MNEEELVITPVKSKEELIENYARVHGITVEEAAGSPLMQGETVDDILLNLRRATIAKIENDRAPKNRAERRAREKKLGKKGRFMADEISETARRLNYIDLIQKLRELNEKKKGEVYEDEETN